MAFNFIGNLKARAERVRKPAGRLELEKRIVEARDSFVRQFLLFQRWREAYPDAEVDHFDRLSYRQLELAAMPASPIVAAELDWLRTIPSNWKLRLSVGDSARRFVASAPTSTPGVDTIRSLDGDFAVLVSDGQRVPLYYLKPAGTSDLPRFTRPLYLLDLAQTLLHAGSDQAPKPYPERGAVAKAVKRYLAGQGLAVRTKVQTGSMMSGIELNPVQKAWTSRELARLEKLLPGVNARADGATIHPWAREGREGNLMVDDYGSPSGIRLDPEQLSTFAPYLAAALREANQRLSPAGEALLVAQIELGSDGAPSVREVTDDARPVATPQQGGSSQGGCFELSFDLPGFGQVRVACGRRGRRDSWDNLVVGGKSYGWNGSRWARGEVPPREVLEAVWNRGVRTFRVEERLALPASDIPLDPVIRGVVENGGLKEALLRDIGPELRQKARAIPGFLRRDGRSWLELAQAHYGPDVEVIKGESDATNWWKPNLETTAGFIELVHWGLAYSFPEATDLDEGREEALRARGGRLSLGQKARRRAVLPIRKR
jgi:hypothetical protein